MAKPNNCIQVQPCNCPQIYWEASGEVIKGVFYNSTVIWTCMSIDSFDCDRIGGNLYGAHATSGPGQPGGTIYMIDFAGNKTSVATYSAGSGGVGAYTLRSAPRVCNAQNNVLFLFAHTIGSPGNIHIELWRMNMDGTGFALLCDITAALVAQGLPAPNVWADLAQHADTGDIYTTAQYFSQYWLLKISADGSTVTQLSTSYALARGLSVGSLDLDYVNNKLWLIASAGTPLYKSNLDGSGLTSVSASLGSGANGLQVDNYSDRIYYFLGIDQIWSINTDGTGNVQLGSGFSSGGTGRLSEDYPTDAHYGTS